MNFADICCSVADYMGRLTGKSHNALSSTQKKLKDSTQALNPKNLPEKIRNAIFKKLSQTLYRQAEFMMGKLSERMETIDEVARPFYEKVNALIAHGPVSEAQLWEAMNSIEAAKKLSKEEKVLLVTIFGQIAGVQKPKFVNATVVEEDSSANPKSKSRLDAGTNGTN
ncbi:MAG: hypothetical protein HQ580_06585 [Planctomycetes bacterium]|nr:hypothetical protein [Planctomycetota bacterium]